MGELSKAQRKALELIAPRLPFYGSRRDLLGIRRDVLDSLFTAGLLSTPMQNLKGSRKYELTDAGRAALRQGGEDR